MSLTTRVSLFFLGALAVVLAGFVVGVYQLAGMFFRQYAEERLLTTFHALVASAEIEPDGVEWNPQEHHLAEYRFRESEPIHWVVTTTSGSIIDSSREALSTMAFAIDPRASAEGAIETLSAPDLHPWWIVRQRLTIPEPEQSAPVSSAVAFDDADDIPEYPELIVTAGISVASTEASLHRLAAWIIPLALALWMFAAVGGRWYCRRALDPVWRMAAATGTMNASAREARIPVPRSSDELEELGLAFNALLDRVHESFERQRRFTGEASHQLRTPITILQGQIEVALRHERSPEEHRQVLEELLIQSRRLGEVVESLLFLARSDSEARLDRLQPLELNSWLIEHFSDSRSDQKLILEPARDEDCWIAAISPLLGQLVDTLVENAIRYSPSGQAVTVRVKLAADEAYLIVEDHGAGISPGEIAHIFEPFFRAESARREHPEGLGLGLAVARQIAGAFGARISASSELGCGTEMRISFPRLSAGDAPICANQCPGTNCGPTVA